MTDAFFYSLWRPMYQFAVNKGVGQDDAKDVVMEAIYKVIDHYTPEKGPIMPFAFTVLKNGMRNYYRHHSRTIPLEWDIELKAPTPLDDAIRLEQEHHAKSVLSALKPTLAANEIGLLDILQTQLENKGKCNVSEAARTLGIEPLKAFDIIRKIRRRLNSIKPPVLLLEESRMDYMDSSGPEDSYKVRFSLKKSDEDDLASILKETEGIAVFVRISDYLNKARL